MFELITQIIILVAIYFLLRFILTSFINKQYLTWLGGFVLVVLLVMAFLEPSNRTVGILWSILSLPLKPLGLALILLAYAVRQGVKKVTGPQVLAALLILLISSLPLTAYLLTTQTEQALLQPPPAGNVSAIVVLGDGALPSDPTYRIRTQLNSMQDGISISQRSRLVYAGQLYQEQAARGNFPAVIVSVGSNPMVTQQGSETRVVQEVLAPYVPSDRIFVDLEGGEPRTSAISTQNILRTGGARTPVIVVAPALNIRRVASSFAKLNFAVIARPTDYFVFQLQQGLRLAAITDLIPSADALAITTRAIDEYLATVYYFLRGWLVDPLGV